MKNQTYRMTMLFDFYGETLTERQKEFFDLYYNEDLSLGEIAENYGISRQGVRDVIVRAEAILTDLEDKTGLIKRFHAMHKQLQQIAEHPPTPRLKGHLQQQRVRSLHAQERQLIVAAQALKIADLRPKSQLRHPRLQSRLQALPRLFPPAQKPVRTVFAGVKMRRGSSQCDALRSQLTQHPGTLLRAAAAVIHTRQHVCVQVDHFVSALVWPPACL